MARPASSHDKWRTLIAGDWRHVASPDFISAFLSNSLNIAIAAFPACFINLSSYNFREALPEHHSSRTACRYLVSLHRSRASGRFVSLSFAYLDSIVRIDQYAPILQSCIPDVETRAAGAPIQHDFRLPQGDPRRIHPQCREDTNSQGVLFSLCADRRIVADLRGISSTGHSSRCLPRNLVPLRSNALSINLASPSRR